MAGSKRARRHVQRDVLVAIKSDHLRAAMELDEWTVTSLASRLGKGENPQTLHHLAQGSGLKRCRASRRKALANVLDVTEDWLAGEPYWLPLPGVMPMLKEVEGSPRVVLAVGRLFGRCADAVQRDLEKEPKRPDLPNGWNATNDVHWFMFSTLGSVLSPVRWQFTLTHRPAKGPPPTIQELEANLRAMPDLVKWFEPLPPSMWAPRPAATALAPDVEAAVLALIRAWTHILQPWLDGEATFDYERFWKLAAVLNPSVGHMLPQSWHGRPSPETLPAAGPTSPYALVDWPLEKPASAPEEPPQAG